ncbi:DUF2868 domain-containing protein [Ignatzschineria sp. LJL83]
MTENIETALPHSIQNNPSSPFSKGVFGFCGILLFLVTIISSTSLLSSPIHPIALVLGILVPAYFFLLFALIRKHSLFTTLLLFFQKWIHRFQEKQDSLKKAQNLKLNTTFDPQLLLLLSKVIMHSAWIIVFTAITLSLFFQFTLQQYHFNLTSTLFPEDSRVYQHIIQVLNAIPDLIFGELISPKIIDNSLKSNIADNNISTNEVSNDKAWAIWVIVMIICYGLLPRIILALWAFRNYKRYQTTLLTAETPKAQIIDPAAKRPIQERAPKTITKGNGSNQVALDFAHELPENILIINDRNAFNHFKDQLTKHPLHDLILYIDGNLTPDRSLLRRIYTLMNLSINNTIILVESSQSRTDEWQRKLAPNLYPNESIILQKSPM